MDNALLSHSTLLTWMIFAPLIGIPVILALPSDRFRNWIRAVATAATAAPLLLCIPLFLRFRPDAKGFQLVQHFVWIRDFNIEYFVGIDGLSVLMVLLTALITFIACIASYGIEKKIKGFFAMLLLLETGMMGVFCALDFFLFYVFWEIMLLPMYFLIGIWGGPRKEYAAIKFFLYTLAGSVVMLLAMIAVYFASTNDALVDGTPARHTFNLVKLASGSLSPSGLTLLGLDFGRVVFVGLFVGFAIKIPMFPFHTWLPDAHVEAPTPISVILAGILLKMGPYGILRINYGLLPDATIWAATTIAVFGMINIVYAAYVCMAQKDLKKLIAYSSVSHMGFVLLGMSAFTQSGISGAVLQMWTHGLISPMLFLIAGVVYDRAHHREIAGFGGLAHRMPEYTTVMGLAFMASLGLPGLCGFISEALCFIGAFPVYRVLTIVSATAVVITAAYYLWTLQRMFLGPLNEKYAAIEDLNWRERVTLYPLGALIVLFGFYPMPLLDLINPSLFGIVDRMQGLLAAVTAAASGAVP
jgi:NADH-quinone oxidoreductase subunit M